MNIARVIRFEEAAILKLFGARFTKGALTDGRVLLEFDAKKRPLMALDDFRAGMGPQGNLADFASALGWAKDLVFSLRRQSEGEHP